MVLSGQVGPAILDSEAVGRGVALVAADLNARFSDAVVISVVPGGILFTADLVRQLKFGVRMDIISCPHTPGARHNDSPILYPATIDIAGVDVIVTDDAVESGGTMRRILEHLSTFGPASLSVATLLVKPGRIDLGVKQYYGHELASDDPIVGYGLPWQDRLRNLPYVAKLALL